MIKNYVIMAMSVLALSMWSCSGSGNENEEGDSTAVAEQVKEFPERASDMTIYEVNIRQHTAEGTLKAFTQDLPRLKQLGTEILWIMPIQPIGKEKRKGGLGSYYSIQDYIAVNPEFGTIDDFKAMVAEAHALGLYVILDWVPNHTAWDNPWITENPEFYAKDSLGNIIYEADWTDIALLDHTNPNTRKAMIEKMAWWITETNIDGFRCDHAAHEIPMLFWEEAMAELNPLKDLFWLAEWDEPKLHPLFHASYGWGLFHLTNEVAKGEKSSDALADAILADLERYGQAPYRLNIITNHDENAWNGTVFERYGDAHKLYAVFSFTSYGVPMIYSGQEAGLNKRLRFFEKDTVEWSDPMNLQPFYESLVDLKKDNPALDAGSFGGKPVFREDDNDQILAYSRSVEGNAVTTILNFSGEEQTATILGLEQSKYTEYFSGDSMTPTDGKVTIPGFGYLVLIHSEKE